MLNPWVKLPDKPPYVLPEDFAVMERWARKNGPTAARFEVPPAPFAGCPERSVVLLLLLNPGFKEYDIAHYNGDPVYQRMARGALDFSNDPPFWCLSNEVEYTGAYQWLYARCRTLIEACGIEALRRGMMQIQYFGYKSERYEHHNERLPSQEYAFSLVRRAIHHGKLIVLTRSARLWTDAVPELIEYPYIQLRNPRSPLLNAEEYG